MWYNRCKQNRECLLVVRALLGSFSADRHERRDKSVRPISVEVCGGFAGRRREEVISMKIIVTGKNITISDKIQDAIDKKFEKLGKYFADDIQAKVVIHPEKAKVKMETTIVTKGTIFRAEDVSQDVFDCIDIVGDKLMSQMSKYKGKLQKRNKSKESVRFEMIPEAAHSC